MSEHPAGLVARRFVHAVVWGEHLMVWELLSPMARQAAIAVAERNGHDALASARARAGTWTDEEADMLLGDLVKGLRFDFSAVDVASISVGDVSVAAGPDGVRAIVPLTVPSTLPAALTGGDGWSAGHVEVIETSDGWRIERLVARRTRRS